MNHQVFEITGQAFDTQVLASAVPVLIEFTADWCPPCKMLAPIMHEIASDYAGRLRVGLIDSDEHTDIVQRYGVMDCRPCFCLSTAPRLSASSAMCLVNALRRSSCHICPQKTSDEPIHRTQSRAGKWRVIGC